MYSLDLLCLGIFEAGDFLIGFLIWCDFCCNSFRTEICIGGRPKPNRSFLYLSRCLLDCLFFYLFKEALTRKTQRGSGVSRMYKVNTVIKYALTMNIVLARVSLSILTSTMDLHPKFIDPYFDYGFLQKRYS